MQPASHDTQFIDDRFPALSQRVWTTVAACEEGLDRLPLIRLASEP